MRGFFFAIELIALVNILSDYREFKLFFHPIPTIYSAKKVLLNRKSMDCNMGFIRDLFEAYSRIDLLVLRKFGMCLE